jgi:adhesin transport system outer membrane protein
MKTVISDQKLQSSKINKLASSAYNDFKIKFSIFLLMSHMTCFGQGHFKETIQRSIENYPPVASARSQLSSATAEMETAKWSFYPTPSAAYERGNKQVIGATDQDMKYFRLQQPIWTAGRLTAQKNKTESQFSQAKFSLEEQRLLAVFRWLQIWADYQNANQKILAYQDGEAKHFEYFQRIQRRAIEGYSAVSDIDLSQSRLASMRSEIQQFIVAKSQSKLRLEQMLGRPLTDDLLLKADSGWDNKPKYYSEFVEKLINIDNMTVADRHPATQKILMLVDVASAELSVIKSRNSPELYLRGEVRRGNLTGTDHAVYFGLSTSFGAGLSNFSAINGALARVEAAQNDVNAKRMEIVELIQSEIENLKSHSERILQLEKSIESSKNYLLSSERQFLAGRRSWQDVLNTAREEVQLRVQISDSKTQIWLAYQRLQILASGVDSYLLNEYSLISGR